MLDAVTLSCPSCGGNLQITNDIERFACAHCGRQHLVKRSGGIVALAPLVHSLQAVDKNLASVGVGLERQNLEFAYKRLLEELQSQEGEVKAAEYNLYLANNSPNTFAWFICLLLVPVGLGCLAVGCSRMASGPAGDGTVMFFASLLLTGVASLGLTSFGQRSRAEKAAAQSALHECRHRLSAKQGELQDLRRRLA